jgi:hypothetical protein
MRIAILLLSVGLIGADAWAQQGSSRWQARFRDRPATLSAGLEIGIPVGAFADDWGREIVGFSANAAVPMRLLPFDLGFDFAWGRMGGESSVVAVNEAFLTATSGNLKVNSNVYGYHAVARFKPTAGKINPYIEGLAGLRQFTTKSELRVDGVDSPVRKDRNANSFVGSAGWALGLQVAPNNSFYIEGRVERMNTGKVAYVDPRTIRIDASGDVTYETRATNTRTVNVHIGVGMRF